MKKFLFWAVLIFTFSISLSSFISARLTIIILVLSLFTGKSNFRISRFLVGFLDMAIYLVILILGLIYSQETKMGFKVLETSFSLLTIPIIFTCIRDFDEKQFKIILYFFALGLFTACFICLVNAVIQYGQKGNTQVFYFYEFAEVIKSHPTYLAYYLIFAITFGLYLLTYEKPPFHLILVALLILFFFLVLLLTGGQTAFVSLLLVCSYFILKFFLGDKSRNQKLTIGLVIIMMITMFFVSSTQSTKRESELNDSWDRFALWEAAIYANPNILFGVGTGDASTVLNEYFRIHNLNEFAVDSLNSHNQFIQIYLSNGLIGLLALLLMLARPLYLSFKNNNSFGILVFFPFLIYGMTEVFLGRYQGVVFFALLHQVFVSYYASSKPAFSLKEA